jgi:NAD(P)-dependent dehydrogenase (short-subunit alcohol dehydrogenase family)
MVNNAGVYRNGKRLHEFDEADLDVCYEVNVKGTFFGAKAAIRRMLEQGDGGVIVNLVSPPGSRAPQPVRLQHLQRGAGQPHPVSGDRVRQGPDPGQRDLPDLREDLAHPRAVRRQGLRPGLHRVDPAQAVG